MTPSNQPLPVVAVTMGDAAGIGPEVIVPALLDDTVRGLCNPVVIGDAKRLRKAAELVGLRRRHRHRRVGRRGRTGAGPHQRHRSRTATRRPALG